MDEVLNAIEHLERIARLNNDEFQYEFVVRTLPKPNGLRWEFECAERADGHAFCAGSGGSPDASVAGLDIRSACQSWGYDYCE